MPKVYEDKTDLEKIQSQWDKLTGLHSRAELSAAIVRTPTAAELATNFAIREEFRARSNFDAKFVDSLLLWANGLAGKMDRLLLPLRAGKKNYETIKKLKAAADKINKERNAIAHQGHFSNEDEAKAAIQQTRKFIETMVHLYQPGFALKDQKRAKGK